MKSWSQDRCSEISMQAEIQHKFIEYGFYGNINREWALAHSFFIKETIALAKT